MPPRLAASLAFVLLTVAAHATPSLPDACGKDNVQFKVKTSDAPSSLPAPAPAQARIVFLEDPIQGGRPTIRFGYDGAWAGALRGKSFFVLPVSPGIHHLCASWQAGYRTDLDLAAAMPLSVDAGKTYFVAYRIVFASSSYGATASVTFAQINDDEAAFLLRSSSAATWASKVLPPIHESDDSQ